MERNIGVHKTYLVQKKNNKIITAVVFVDDYRPDLKIDRRYAQVDYMGGCCWYSDRKNFSTKEEGNAYYTQLKAKGYVAGTETEVEDFVRFCGDITY